VNALAWLIAVGGLSGAAALFVFRHFTNVTRLRQTANHIVAHLLEIQLFSEEPRVVLRAQRDLFAANGRLLLQLALPSLLLLLPFALTLVVLDQFFGHIPLRPGDTVLVTAQYKGPAPQAVLEAPTGIVVDTPPVSIPAERQLVWRIHAKAATNGELRLTTNGTSIGKHIAVANGFAWTSVRRSASFLEALRHPAEWPFSSETINYVEISYGTARIFHAPWLLWYCLGSIIGAALAASGVFRHSRAPVFATLLCLTLACSHVPTPKVIVLGIDGMDPGFVERHWDALPNLRALRNHGYFGRLRTTAPPQSPVAWSTFITGLDPDQHGIYDFVHRDPVTHAPFSSMSKTEDAKFVLPLGPYLLPLSSSHVFSLRHGTPFWRILADHGIPVIIQHIPANYPPEPAGKELAGMGTPDLLGTLGTFTFFTDDPLASPHFLPGGRIVKTLVANGRASLTLEGPPNPLRKNHAATSAVVTLDIDPINSVARVTLGDRAVLIQQGEWSAWLTAEFTLIPHISSIRGIIRLYAKQLHPGLEIYVSPINLDAAAPALPISWPQHWSSQIESEIGPYATLGVPEDTSALRQELLTLPEFQEQTHLVFAEEAKLLNYSLRQFSHGLLFFYFSSVDENSHILWGKYDDELLKVYREVDDCVGVVRRQQPGAQLFIISDHGFTTFDRAVHLNSWLKQSGFAGQAYAIGLNGLYLNRKGDATLLAALRRQLLAWRDPSNERTIVETLIVTHPAPENARIAPDLIVGYAPGYRASWQTALGESPATMIENNDDAWIADHCINPDDVPGVLFSSTQISPHAPRLQDVTAAVLKLFGIPPAGSARGRIF
jgi:predicted AlkP superfamily phosphohydrolase/phosphomutase